jgi:hypothetical protein
MLTDTSVAYLGKERIASGGLGGGGGGGEPAGKVQSVDGTVILNWKVSEWLGGYGKISLAQGMDK